MSVHGLVGYAVYLPRHRLQRAGVAAALGTSAGRGTRVVAAFDEDSTTMAVEAARLLRAESEPPASLYLATTSPAYLDKTNAAAVHAALGLPADTFCADLAGSARSGIAAWRAAAATGGLAITSDVRTGRPGSADESRGGDGAAVFRFGDAASAIAEVIAESSQTTEVLDRWRAPGDRAGAQWEERFGSQEYLPLLKRTAATVLATAGIEQADHVVLVSPNAGAVKQGQKAVSGRISTSGSPIGHAGAADAGIGLAGVLDRAAPHETILVLSAVDGCDAVLLRTTERIEQARQERPVAEQLADGVDVSYPTYLSWRGWLEREPPRRPEPDRPAGPPSARTAEWKFSFVGASCRRCGFVHLPPTRVCKKCRVSDEMEPRRLADTEGTIATYTVDLLAFSAAPPLIDAVVDFDGGGRYTLEVADTDPSALEVGARVVLTFRKLFTAGGVHNYFWKARVTCPTAPGRAGDLVSTRSGVQA